LQADEKSNTRTLRVAVRGLCGGLIAAILLGATVSAGTPAPTAAKKHVSPYARAAAAQRARDAQTSRAHAPTMVQGMGKTHKTHVGASTK
jgi:hypothetical protein